MCANTFFLWENMKNNVVSLFFNKFWWTHKWHRKYATKRYFEGFVDSECASCHTIIKVVSICCFMLRQQIFAFFLVSVTIRHNSEAVPIQLVEKYAKKKLLTKTKISKFLCAWCSTILKIFETTLYTHKVFVATILACYNFLAQLQGCSKWAYCIFYTFFFKKFFCCTQQAQQKNFFIIFWKSAWRSQNFFLRP